MQFTVHKIIIQKKRSPFKDIINLLILIIAVPVIIIAGISLSIYFLFIWIKNILFEVDKADSSADHYHLELDLIRNQHIHIVLVEDELDMELTQLNEAWQEKVYDEETCLYRLKITPSIPALEGRIGCYFLKEDSLGLFLQLLPIDNNSTLNSELVFLDYQDFNLTHIDQSGPFFLYNDEENKYLIKGISKSKMMDIMLLPCL